MAREGALRAGPRDGEGTASLSASRTVLVVTPEPTKAGEVVGALQDRGVPSIQATTPVGLQNVDTSHAALRWYSWISPPRTSRRRTSVPGLVSGSLRDSGG
jgi:hypothetical protein